MSKQIDRIVTIEDEKARILDFLNTKFERPDEGIYEGKVRYYKANLAWATIIEGFLHFLASVAAWQDADDETDFAIQQILIFIEGIEIVTPDEMRDAIRDGLYQWTNDVAKQIISGRVTDISVDAEGNVSSASEAGVEIPEDDPFTAIDEEAAGKAGAAFSVAYGINEFIGTLNTLFGIDSSADTPLADAISLISYMYVTNVGMPAAITEYYIDRAADLDALADLNSGNLASYIYCHAFQSAQQSVLKFIASSASISQENKLRYNELIVELEETQFNIWQNAGAQVPTTEYFNFDCVSIPPEVFFVPLDTEIVPNGTARKNHRFKYTVSGSYTDADGDIQDAWYYKSAAGNPVFRTSGFKTDGAGFITYPTSAEVPYRTDHIYTWTIDIIGTQKVLMYWSKDAGMAAASSGMLSAIVVDLGEFIP